VKVISPSKLCAYLPARRCAPSSCGSSLRLVPCSQTSNSLRALGNSIPLAAAEEALRPSTSHRFDSQFGGHHGLGQYGAELPPNELVVYTWPDATLRELTELIKSAQPAARRQNVRLEFALVYPDARGRNTMRPVRPTKPHWRGWGDLLWMLGTENLFGNEGAELVPEGPMSN